MKTIDRHQFTKWIRCQQANASKQKDSAFEAHGLCQQFDRWQRRFELLGDCLAILNEYERDFSKGGEV